MPQVSQSDTFPNSRPCSLHIINTVYPKTLPLLLSLNLDLLDTAAVRKIVYLVSLSVGQRCIPAEDVMYEAMGFVDSRILGVKMFEAVSCGRCW